VWGVGIFYLFIKKNIFFVGGRGREGGGGGGGEERGGGGGGGEIRNTSELQLECPKLKGCMRG